jgi:pSer/pThr/pTyr-binding forkhead associated (FHA) protein
MDGDFWIEDLNSTNGTRVNGATITRQKLANNDQINVGDTIITFALESS